MGDIQPAGVNIISREMYRLLVTLLLLVSALAGGESRAEQRSGEAESRVVVTTLAQLDFPSGITFSEITLPVERSLLFPVPGEMANAGGILHIRYRCSGQLPPEAALGATLNEEAELLQPLEGGGAMREWQLPITSAQLAGGQLKVLLRVHWNKREGEMPALDADPATIRISPQSDLTTNHAGRPLSLRDAWLTLPERVTLAIPSGELSTPAYASALEWTRLLQRHRHQVRVVTLPTPGDLVLAPRDELARTAAMQGALTVPFWRQRVANLGIVQLRERTVIVATTPYEAPWGDDLSWVSRDGAVNYHNTLADSTAQPPSRISLQSLGISSETAQLGEKLQWAAHITPWHLPPGMRPLRAVLGVALPRSRNGARARLFIYLNERMVTSALLPMDGATHALDVSLHDLAMDENYLLRIVAIRLGDTAAAQAERYLPVAITAQSLLELEPMNAPVQGLSSLPARFGRGINLYLPYHYLAEGADYLPRLARVMNGFLIPRGHYQLQIREERLAGEPREDFIAAAELAPPGVELPLLMDRGVVEMVGQHGRIVLGDPQLRAATLLQARWHRRVAGLWVTPGSEQTLPAIDSNRLGGDDVAIYGANGVILSFNSHYQEMAHPYYRDYISWYRYLETRRYEVLLAMWFVLAAATFYLYRKSKHHHST